VKQGPPHSQCMTGRLPKLTREKNMSIFDFANGSDKAADAGRTVGAEAGGIAHGAYDRKAAATHDSQGPIQQQAQTEALIKDKVIPHLPIDGLKSMSGDATPSTEKIGVAIGDDFHPGKASDGGPKAGRSASTTGDALPPSGSLLPEKTAEVSVRKS
jgi:hypothetical protein